MIAMADIVVEILGWVGAVLTLVAYILLTTKRLGERSLTYHGMNLTGGAALAINAVINGAYPSSAVNIIWIMIAAFGLFKWFTHS